MTVRLAHADPKLVSALRRMGGHYGPQGVAEVAVQLAGQPGAPAQPVAPPDRPPSTQTEEAGPVFRWDVALPYHEPSPLRRLLARLR